MNKKNTLTKEAKTFAVGMFQVTTELSFRRPHIIHTRTRKALDNLVANGYLEKVSHRQLCKGAEGWRTTEKMKELISGKSIPNKEDFFPLTTE